MRISLPRNVSKKRVRDLVRKETGPRYAAIVNCQRCGGLVIEEQEFFMTDGDAELVAYWRCVICGNQHFKG